MSNDFIYVIFLVLQGRRIRAELFDEAVWRRGLWQVRLLRDRLQEGRREVGVQGDLGGEEPTANGRRRGASQITIRAPRPRAKNAVREK